MLVCPHCRHENDEGETQCASCGRSLEPGLSAMRSVRRAEGTPIEFEVRAPQPRSLWPMVATLVTLAVVGAGMWLYFATRPDPCRGQFSSDQFPYCVQIPAGWEAQPAALGDQTVLDQFFDPKGVSTVLVAAFDLADNTSLDSYAAATRQSDQQGGNKPGPVVSMKLGGVSAQSWDVTSTNKLGETYRTREVVAVDGNVGWTVELTDTARGFDAHLPSFQRMLATWHFQ